MDAKVVFVLGAPGAGKGTQCAKIVEKFGWTHLSAGDLLRNEVAAGSELGLEAKALMAEGQMVPTSLVLNLLMTAMQESGSGTFLIDGFPRKLDQLEEFENKIKPCDGVLVFTVPDDVAMERLVKRGESSGRADDNEETIRKRMQVFKEESQPVIDALKDSGRVAEIDAQGDPDEVFVTVGEFMGRFISDKAPDATEGEAATPAAEEETADDPAEEAPTAEEPETEVTSPADEPATEQASAGEGEPAAEEEPAAEAEAAAEDETPATEEEPAGEGVLAGEESPAGAGEPAGDEAPAIEDEPAAEEGEPAAEEVEPAAEEPAAEEGEPAAEEGEPAAEEGEPAAEEPAAEEGEPAVEEVEPAAEESAAEEGESAAEEVEPAVEEVEPAAEEPAAEEAEPAAEEPAAEEGEPAEEEEVPAATEDEPAAEELPVTEGEPAAEKEPPGEEAFATAEATADEEEAPASETAPADVEPEAAEEEHAAEEGSAAEEEEPAAEDALEDSPAAEEGGDEVIEAEEPAAQDSAAAEEDPAVESVPAVEEEVPVVESSVTAAHASIADARIVFVLGAPGAGKGTQCARIVARDGWTHLSTGDLLRKEVSEGSDLGKQASSIMEAGGMVPTHLILDLLIAAMSAPAAVKRFLVDGFPRKLDQLQEFEAKIKPCDGVLVFTVPDDVAVERLVKRGESSGRADDNEETIRKRMQIFQEESQPVIDALKGSGRVGEIDAQGYPDDIFIDVCRFMDGMSGQENEETPAEAGDAAVESDAPASDAKEYTPEEVEAVKKLQAGARGMLGRKRVNQIRTEKNAAGAPADESEAVAEDAVTESMSSPQAFDSPAQEGEAPTSDAKQYTPEEEEAVKKLQAGARGMLGRKRVNQIKAENNAAGATFDVSVAAEDAGAEETEAPPEADAPEEGGDAPTSAAKEYTGEELEAVKKLQAGARGMLGRKRVNQIKADKHAAGAPSDEVEADEAVQEESESTPKAAAPEAPLEATAAPAPSADMEKPIVMPVPPSSSKPTTPQRPISSSPRPGSKLTPQTSPSPPEAQPSLTAEPSALTAALATAPTKALPVRQYMDQTVVPILREALRSLNDSRPHDPLQFLADYLLAARAKRLNGI